MTDLLEQLIADRRDFHRHPELAYSEHRTARIIAERLSQYGYEVRTGVGQTGVIGLLRFDEPGRTLLYRADMDALPIEEQNEVDYRSQNPGAMHACGHDAHLAIALGVAKLIADDRAGLRGNLKLAFQPAEEAGGGALAMIRDGALDGVSAAVGLHIWNDIPVGKVAVSIGPMMAAVDEFEIVIEGRGGHGAMPHQAVDAIVVAAHVITALQTVISRQVSPLEPAVLTVGRVAAGTAFNVIAERAILNGTVRTFNKDTHQKMPAMIERVIRGVTESMGASYRLDYRNHTPPLVNDPEIGSLVAECAAEVVGRENVLTGESARTMGGEDMSYFLERVPGCYFFVGSRNEDRGLIHPHHSPRFDIDEGAMEIAVQIMTRIIRRYLGAQR